MLLETLCWWRLHVGDSFILVTTLCRWLHDDDSFKRLEAESFSDIFIEIDVSDLAPRLWILVLQIRVKLKRPPCYRKIRLQIRDKTSFIGFLWPSHRHSFPKITSPCHFHDLGMDMDAELWYHSHHHRSTQLTLRELNFYRQLRSGNDQCWLGIIKGSFYFSLKSTWLR